MNWINKVVTLEDGTKLIVLDQLMYLEKSYFLTSQLNQEGTDISPQFSFLVAVQNDDGVYLSPVEDKSIEGRLAQFMQNSLSVS